jgi:uncharacterized membrane protein
VVPAAFALSVVAARAIALSKIGRAMSFLLAFMSVISFVGFLSFVALLVRVRMLLHEVWTVG